MGLEIEAKMRVDDLGAVRERLRAIGASFVSRVMETNTFLDKPDGSMKKQGQGLRVRTNRNVDTGAAPVVITFKGPLQAGALKSREERELTVDSHEDAVALFDALGLEVRLSFEKRRESWTVGDCKIELDELPELGTFVEIEGPSEESVMGVRERLGMSDAPLGKEGYASMVAVHLKRYRDGTKELRFS